MFGSKREFNTVGKQTFTLIINHQREDMKNGFIFGLVGEAVYWQPG